MPSEKILIVDDDPEVRRVLESYLRLHKIDVACAADGTIALEMAAESDLAVAIVDLSLPGISGMETSRRLKKLSPNIEIIIFTGNPSFDTSIHAIHDQVFDYICKPCEMSTMLKTIQKALEHRRLIIENQNLLRQLQTEKTQLEQEVTAARRVIEQRLKASAAFLGRSAAIEEIRHQVAQIGPASVNVLLLGESGTGKDVIAQLIHESSGRDPNAFVKVNCPAIPESLLESELFGYEAGAFTGAVKRKPGRFELASGGTLFLDEIGDLPLALQAKLLQCVEQKQFYSVGGKKPIHVDVRIVAATNVPLSEMMDGGKFRADLYYRLSEYLIHIPPLRERKEDILLLCNHFLKDYKQQFNCPEREIPSEVQEQICTYDWPGNVRELQSFIRRFVLTGQEDHISQFASKPSLSVSKAVISPSVQGEEPSHALLRNHNSTSNDFNLILRSLAEARWNRRKAAKNLGISYSTLRRRLAEYNKEEKSIKALHADSCAADA